MCEYTVCSLHVNLSLAHVREEEGGAHRTATRKGLPGATTSPRNRLLCISKGPKINKMMEFVEGHHESEVEKIQNDVIEEEVYRKIVERIRYEIISEPKAKLMESRQQINTEGSVFSEEKEENVKL